MQQTSPLEVGIPVVDMDRMLAFYSAVLSCNETRRADIPAALSQGLTAGADGYLNVWLQTPGGEVIKLMRPPQPPRLRPVPAALSEVTGIAYLTFYCTDIAAALALAEQHGATLRSDRGLLDGSVGVKLCFFADPEGNIIELVETL
ncbi:MAG: VOC family protein [Pseudomonadales bacterium]